MTVATPDNPMVQLGDFSFGKRHKDFKLDRAMLLGWVTNNYWGTNFRAHQPGEVRAHYRLMPYAGEFDEGKAHRFGMETAVSMPLLQQFGEPQQDKPFRPPEGSLLHLPDEPNILTLHIKPARDGEGIVVRLLNAGDREETAVIQSAQLQIQSAQKCNLLEEFECDLAVDDGSVSLKLVPRTIAVVQLIIWTNTGEN
jgi:alpha-mannosidase